MSKTTDIVQNAIQDIVTNLGYSIVDVELAKEGQSKILYVYIYHENGISLSDCEAVSTAIDPIIDEIDPVSDQYFLCVSSPGIDRPLKTDADFKRNIGAEVEISLYKAVNKKKSFIGVLTAHDEGKNELTISCEGTLYTFNIKELARIRPYIRF